jgi:hypothetical protein
MSEKIIEIVYPRGARHRAMPKEAEIRTVLSAVCKLAGFEENRVKFCVHSTMNKNPHQASFKLRSVKQEDSFAVSVEVTGKRSIAIGHLYYTDEDGVPMRGQSMYDHIFGSLGDSRVLKLNSLDSIPTDTSEEQTLPTEQTVVIENAQGEESETEGNISANTTSNDDVSSTVTSTPEYFGNANYQGNYQGFFKDLAKLQLAIIALCARYNPPSLFSSKDFNQTLREDLGIQSDHRATLPFLVSFRDRGYIKRINPDQLPARYVMTDLAIRFAEETLPSSQYYKPQIPRKPSSHVDSGLKKLASAFDSIVYLKEREKFYQEIQDEIQRIKASEKLDIDTLRVERQSLEQEKSSLEEELRRVTSRLNQIDELQKTQADESERITNLELQLIDPTLQAELSELAKIRAMLGE